MYRLKTDKLKAQTYYAIILSITPKSIFNYIKRIFETK